jgi:16S rRNA (cytosine1402-N4)-methyltransferase
MHVHKPVLLEEVLRLLEPPAGESLLVDATLGEGGHAEAFLSRFPGLTVFGVDKDQEILGRARTRLQRFTGRVEFFHRGFAEFFEQFDQAAGRRPDRILLDLGVSLFHFEASGRGFSFRKAEPLDMRLDTSRGLTAAELVNGSTEERLQDILREYGEERLARRIARAIVRAREKAPIARSDELAEVVRRAVPPEARHGRIHPATRTFQALRIAVNGELDELERALPAALAALAPGGRMGVIAFHSLEDRAVKRFFQERARACTCPPESPICQCGGHVELEILTRKPVTPGEGERLANPASRSAKLRVARKV